MHKNLGHFMKIENLKPEFYEIGRKFIFKFFYNILHQLLEVPVGLL